MLTCLRGTSRSSMLTTLLTLVALSSVFSQRAFAQTTSETNDRLKAALQRFPEADANKDGVLTVDEAKAFLEQRRKQARPERSAGPAPTFADVKYGPNERNVFDVWLPEGASREHPVPVFVFFHGGGFVAGDKSHMNPQPYLDRGYAVMSSNYRFVNGKDVLCPVPMQDATRALQYLRYKAGEFGIDPQRVAVSGGSAGAVITMWIAYKDDMADPDSDDPVQRQSTRVTCITPKSGPTNLDPEWIVKHIGGSKEVHSSMPMFYGVEEDDAKNEKVQGMIRDASAINHVTADDPPSMIIYRGEVDNVPLPETASQGLVIHHPYFGKVLKEKLDKVGVECHFLYGNQRSNEQELEFLKKHFGK